MKNTTTLADRKHELTRKLILDAAVDLLERSPVNELTVRAAAQHANISERTVFRYFPSRDDLLDAVTGEIRIRMAMPAPPETMAQLLAAPRALYEAFEKAAGLTKAALHSELYERMRESGAKERWRAVAKLIDALAPHMPAWERTIAAANIRYYLAASSWHYYRYYFGFSLDESIDCAEAAVRLAVESLKKK